MKDSDSNGCRLSAGRNPTGRRGGTVRVAASTQRTLRDLAQEMDEPIQEVVARAVEAYRRQRVLELTNSAFAALRADPERWREELEERELWDHTLGDIAEDE
jgi:hypothetical protein